MLLIGVFCIGFSMSAWAQKVSLNFEETKVETVLSSIKKQTGMDMVFSDQVLNVNRKVTVRLKNTELKEALNKLLAGTGVTFEIKNNRIYFVEDRTLGKSSKTKRVRGRVTDKSGEPIIGANVLQVGSDTNGTITDVDGNFELEVPGNAKLKVTYIGYTTQEVATDGRISLSISLQEDSELLDEVVVVGYGTARKKDLTGAVGLVKGDDVVRRRTTQLSSALQGAVSGVMVTRSGGAPESTQTIRVRGITTMSTNDPLVIIDGVPGNIDDVNSTDVESMTVLKDAASSAIYGARAAAGVILITTKRAKENDLKLNYTFEYGLDYMSNHPENVGPERFMQMANELRYNDNPAGGEYQTYTQDEIENYRRLNQENPNLYPITDWYDVVYNKTAPKQSHIFNISGGTKHVRTNASLTYDKVEALYDNRDYNRFMMRINNNFIISKWIGADLDFNFKHAKVDRPIMVDKIVDHARAMPAIYGARFTDGRFAVGKEGSGSNPLAYIHESGQYRQWDSQIGGRASLFVTPMDGLKVTAVVAPNYVYTKKKSFEKAMPFTTWDAPDIIAGYRESKKTTKLTENRDDAYNITVQFLLNYIKRFGKHDINFMAGYENYYSFYEGLNALRDQYTLNEYPYLDMGPETLRDNGGNAREVAYRSYFGRIMYGYADRYLLQANIRRDGSSRFHKDNRWGNFPSFSAGWVISEEKFMKDANIDWLSFLKIRGSWGILGNERITANYYPYQAAINLSSAIFFQSGKPIPMQSAAQWAYVVKNLTWEKTKSMDIGLDATFFNNRLRFTAEYYTKKTEDMLLAVEIPDYVGFDNPQQNLGKMETKGFEFDLGWSDQINDFHYSVSVNLSDFRSKMKNMNGTQVLGSDHMVKMEGSEYNEWYGYLSDGLFLTQEDADNSPKLNNNVGVGDVKYKDISGPEGVPDGKISAEYDRVLLGGSLPRLLYGGNISMAYKGIDFSMAFQGVGKQNVRMHPYMVRPLDGTWASVQTHYDGKYWSQYNTDAQNKAAIYPKISEKSVSSNYAMSDFWLFNGRYFRMKNITLGYTLPEKWMNKIFIKQARVYVAANDLFCISNFPNGWDPEMPANGVGYPTTSSVLFGLSVNF